SVLPSVLFSVYVCLLFFPSLPTRRSSDLRLFIPSFDLLFLWQRLIMVYGQASACMNWPMLHLRLHQREKMHSPSLFLPNSVVCFYSYRFVLCLFLLLNEERSILKKQRQMYLFRRFSSVSR